MNNQLIIEFQNYLEKNFDIEEYLQDSVAFKSAQFPELFYNVSPVVSFKQLLENKQKEKRLTNKQLSKITGLSDNDINRLKNEKDSLTTTDKEIVYPILIALKCTYSEIKTFANALRFVIKPSCNVYDAVVDFIVNKQGYDNSEQENIKVYNKCKEFAFEYVMSQSSRML